MRKPRPRKSGLTPDFLKSLLQESESKTDSGENPKDSISAPAKNRDEYIAEALVVLGISPDDLELSPKIEHLFKGIGGQERIFEYLGGSEDKDARTLLDLRKRLNERQRRHVPFEAYCIAAGLSVKKVFGLISAEAMDQEEMAKQLLFRVRHTEVLQATIDNALDPLGSTDRNMLHKAAGFVPVPKNTVTFVRGNQINDSRQVNTSSITVLPPVEDSIKRLGDRFNEKLTEIKALPAPALPILDAEEEGDD